MNQKNNNRKGRRVQRRRWRRWVLVLAVVVALGTAGALILPAMTMEQTPICGMEEHTHTDACYSEKKTLICGMEEGEVHHHTDECYEERKVLICPLPEDENHTHGPECYETRRVLVCGKEEGVPHHHTDECYKVERVLTCGKPEHVHTDACYLRPDSKADMETAQVWEATMPLGELSGNWGQDLAAIARSQIGYRESEENFKLNEAQEKLGYTRYGDWAGDAWQPWNEAFAAFCLHYAGVPDDVIPTAGDSAQWVAQLVELGRFVASGDGTPSVGDLLFVDTSGDGSADQVGVVEEAYDRIQVIEGDAGDRVARRDYDAGDGQIVGFCPVDAIGAQLGEENSKKEYTLTAQEQDMTVTVTLSGLRQELPEGAELEAAEVTRDDRAEDFNAALDGAEALLEKNQEVGAFTLFDLRVTDGGETVPVPATAESQVEVEFHQPLYPAGEVSQAAAVETLVVDAQPEAVETAYGDTEAGLTHLRFESRGLQPFAVMLANETQTGQFWKVCRTLGSREEFKNGGNYMIVSVDGSYALTNNRSSGGANCTRVELLPVKGNPGYYTIPNAPAKAIWKYENSRNAVNFYQGSSRSPSAVVDPSYSGMIATQKTALGFAKSSCPAAFILSNDYYDGYYTYRYYLNYKDTTGSFIGTTGEYIYSDVPERPYDRTSDMLVLQQVDATLTIPQDAVAQDGGTGQQGSGVKPDYPGYVTPSGEKTGSYESDTATVEYASDPSTSQLEADFGKHPLRGKTDYEAQQVDNGKAMMDKSVVYGQDDYDAFPEYGDGVFSVTLSALGQAFVVDQSVSKVPLDVMLVLDMSNSMNETDPEQSQCRAKILVESVNKTIGNIMKANPENRVGAVGFNSGAYDLMELGHHDSVRGGKYFEYSVGGPDDFGNPRISIRAVQRNGSMGSYYPCKEGTYTQMGIAQGYDLLLRSTPRPEDRTYTTTVNGQTITHQRKPVVILVSDGEPTHCTSHYMDVLESPYYGDGLGPVRNARGIQGYYTILSANYYKRMVGIHYDNPAAMYTVAFGMQEKDLSILSGSAATNHYRATVMNPTKDNIDYLENISTKYSDSVETPLFQLLRGTYGYNAQWVGASWDLIPALGKPHALVPVLLENPYRGNYAYADKAYLGNTGNAGLDAAFEDIIKLNTVYDFSYETQANKPLVISDPIGEGMEIKGDPVLRINGQNYAHTGKEVRGNTTTYSYSGVVAMDDRSGRTVDLSTIKVRVETVNGLQTATMEIPPKSLPTYTADPTMSYYQEALPIRLIYQVGLSAAGQAEIESLPTGAEKHFYTNRYEGESAQGELAPSTKNPYYKKSGWKVTENKTSNPTGTDGQSLVKGGTSRAVDYQLGNNGKLTITKKAPPIVPADPVSIEKQWLDWAGEPTAENLPQAITGTLYRTYEGEDGQVIREDVAAFTLNQENGWKHTFTPEELKAVAGRTYKYYVEEDVPEGYQVVYTGDGVESNTPEKPIVITNRYRYSDTTLPQTGGRGTWIFTGLGLTLMAGALISYRYVLTAKHRRKGR